MMRKAHFVVFSTFFNARFRLIPLGGTVCHKEQKTRQLLYGGNGCFLVSRQHFALSAIFTFELCFLGKLK